MHFLTRCRVFQVVVYLALGASSAALAAPRLHQGHADTGSWGFRPARGEVVDVNPPGFSWNPEHWARGYALQVAQDPAFEDVVYARDELPWSSHAAEAVLPHGHLYWRYRAQDEHGEWSGWSEARRFVVGPDAVEFPKLSRGEQAGRIPGGHPRLFFRPEDLPRLRELAGGKLAARHAQLIEQANRILENPPDTSEPPLYPEGTVRKGEAWKKIWWGNRRRAIAAADGAATLGFVYQITGEARYAEAARELLLAVAKWDPDGSTNYKYNDEAAMPLLYYPSRAYTWIYDILSQEDRDAIREVMAVRGRHCFEHLRGRSHLWYPYASHSNRAWHWLGEVAIAFYGEIPEAREWLDYALTIFHTCYPVWGGPDGGWHEGTAYWRSYLGRFMYWALVSDSALGVNVFRKPFFREAGYFGLYCYPPGTRVGGFGDQAILVKDDGIGPLMRLLASASGNAHWQWFAETAGAEIPGYFGFLAEAQARAVEAKAPTDIHPSRVFEDTGLAVLNTNLLNGKDNVQIHFKSSPMGAQSHGYNANNSFLLNLRGRRAFIRSGRRDVHGSPHHIQWMWQTKSDNAILVNGEGQIAHSPKAVGRIDSHVFGEAVDIVAGEAGESYPQLKHAYRKLVFVKPHLLLVIDHLEAHEPATFQWLLHAEQPFTIRDQGFRWEGEHGPVDGVFLTPGNLAITQSDTFDTPPHEWANFNLEEWHLQAAAETPAATQYFLTLLKIDGVAASAQVEREGDVCRARVEYAGGAVDVVLGPGELAVTYPGGASAKRFE